MRFDRLDKTALTVIACLLAAIAIVLLRGDRVGAALTGTQPARAAQNVSLRTPIGFMFAEPMDINSLHGLLETTPLISGTLRGNGSSVFFVPTQPLQANADYQITLRAGGRSLRGRLMQTDAVLRFRTRQPQLAYLTPAAGAANLVLHDPVSGQIRRITSEPYGVFDFAISPDGTRAALSVIRDADGARDLWLVSLDGSAAREQLLRCDAQVCQSPAWSADGTRIAFERRALIQRTIGTLPGPARIWLMDVASKETVPLFADTQAIAALPSWSPVDDRLLVVDSRDSGLTIVDTRSQQIVRLPSNLGDPGAWSPDGARVIYPDITPRDDRGFTQLLRVEFATSVITTVFPISTSDDSSIAFAPSGGQIAFSRRQSGPRAQSGAQVWTAHLDGSGLRQLTDDATHSHFRVSYSPDGALLTAQRFALGEPYAKPEIALLSADGGPVRVLAKDASQPVWVP
jgi:Tol biopolymer transport system component